MIDTLTEADLKRLESIYAKLPAGTLVASDILDDEGGGVVREDNRIVIKSGYGIPMSEFIAMAHTMMPAAISTIRRLRSFLALLPEPEKLLLLADWFDFDDAKKGRTGHVDVQNDLRQWAAAITDIRAALGKE